MEKSIKLGFYLSELILQKTQFPRSIITSITGMKKLKCIYVVLY